VSTAASGIFYEMLEQTLYEDGICHVLRGRRAEVNELNYFQNNITGYKKHGFRDKGR
jgi:hypothetical protein